MASKSTKKCLVTGALGFIGSSVVDLLVAEGHSVHGVDNLSTGFEEYANPKASYTRGDAGDFPDYHRFDWCFHLAACPRIQPSFDEPIAHDDTNVRLTLKILEKLRLTGAKTKVIYSSSSAIYGDPSTFPTPETEPVAPLSPYALQKYSSEKYIEILCGRWGIPWAALRYFNAYGPRSFNPKNKWNAYTSVVGIFHRQAIAKQPLTVTGNGLQRRDFVHVQDIAKANLIVAEKGAGAYNVGAGEAISILDLAKIFADKYGVDITHIPERQGEAQQTWSDTRKLNSLGWQPSWSLSKAIEQGL